MRGPRLLIRNAEDRSRRWAVGAEQLTRSTASATPDIVNEVNDVECDGARVGPQGTGTLPAVKLARVLGAVGRVLITAGTLILLFVA